MASHARVNSVKRQKSPSPRRSSSEISEGTAVLSPEIFGVRSALLFHSMFKTFSDTDQAAGMATIKAAMQPGDLSFIANEKYIAKLTANAIQRLGASVERLDLFVGRHILRGRDRPVVDRDAFDAAQVRLFERMRFDVRLDSTLSRQAQRALRAVPSTSPSTDHWRSLSARS